MGAPTTVNDVDIFSKVYSGRHSPNDIINIGGIDVIVYDYGPAIGVSSSMALRCYESSLLGMPTIHLLNRYRQPKPAAPCFMGPNTLYLWYTRSL